MNPSADSTTPTQQELNDAIREASDNVKTQIFYQAQTTRQETWSEPSKKAKMERTIPIFRALIASDTDDAYHRNHGELGYALKDQRTENWPAAEAELTKAIQIRGSAAEHDWVLYELNRAICRINMDDNSKDKKKSSSDLRKRIVEDLRIGSTDDYTKNIISSNQTIQDWIKVNEVKPEELET